MKKDTKDIAKVADTVNQDAIDVIHTLRVKIVELEKEGVIVLFNGWRIRAYFDKYCTQKDKAKVGRFINVKYTGDIKDMSTVRLLKLTDEELK